MTRQRLKRALLPTSPAPHTVRLGIARGARLQIDFTTQTGLYCGTYEIELYRYLRRILRPGVTVFDVGAQVGYDSLAFANRTRSRVAAFECDETNISTMDANFGLNPTLAPLINSVHAFVGIGSGDLRLDEWAFSEDGFVPGFIKLDIEGHEVAALQSAHRILSGFHPSLVVEVHSAALENQAGRLLTEYGYRPLVISQRRVLPDRRIAEHNRWLVSVG